MPPHSKSTPSAFDICYHLHSIYHIGFIGKWFSWMKNAVRVSEFLDNNKNIIFLKQDLFIYLKGRMTEYDRERDLTCPFSLPRCLQWLSWPAQRQVPRIQSGSSMWVTEVQALGPSSTAFPGSLVGSWIRNGTAGTWMAFWNGLHSHDRWLSSCATNLAFRCIFTPAYGNISRQVFHEHICLLYCFENAWGWIYFQFVLSLVITLYMCLSILFTGEKNL